MTGSRKLKKNRKIAAVSNKNIFCDIFAKLLLFKRVKSNTSQFARLLAIAKYLHVTYKFM